MSNKLFGAIIISAMAFTVSQAMSKPITSYDLKKDHNGYPCDIRTTVDGEEGPTLQLSDYEDTWTLYIYIGNRADLYRSFFKSNGLMDRDRIQDSFKFLKAGNRTFDFHDIFLPVIKAESIDETTALQFKINEKHNIYKALDAISSGSFSIPGLVNVTDSSDSLGEFKSCAFDAIGIEEGERVETDYRAEYRMIFERSFEAWITHMSRAEACLASRFDEAAVDNVVDRAAGAFHPGLFNMRKRSKYKDTLRGRIPLAKLSGYTDSKTEGCMMAGQLAEMALIPVEKSIESAENID